MRNVVDIGPFYLAADFAMNTYITLGCLKTCCAMGLISTNYHVTQGFKLIWAVTKCTVLKSQMANL